MAIPSQQELRAARIARHGEALQRRLDAATVAICGLGGLGSCIAVALARAGVGRLILIDFDRVDTTNLHRQQYDADQVGMLKTEALAAVLRRIDPYIRLTLHNTRITTDNCAELTAGADVVCEAFDDPIAKSMLVDTVLSSSSAYVVAASGMAGLAPANAIRTVRMGKRLYLCGDGVSDVAQDGGLIAPRVMLCAMHQAQAALRIIADQHDV